MMDDGRSGTDLARLLGQRHAGAVTANERGDLVVEADQLLDVARSLRDDYGLDYLVNVTSVDWPDKFELVYHACSSAGGAPITMRVAADKADPVVPSVFSVYPGADFQERELILDLFEMVTGARMMCNYMRFGGVAYDLPEEFMPLAETLAFDRLERAIDEIDLI